MKNNFCSSLTVILSLTILFITSCTYDSFQYEESEIIFEKVNINYAWGFHYTHWIIDGSGNVKMSSRKKTSPIGSPINKAVLAKFDSTIFTVTKEDLAYYSNLAYKAKDGRYQATKMGRYDFGSYSYGCYFLDLENDTYRTCLLSMKSDRLDSINMDDSAIKIVEWLTTINSKVGSDIGITTDKTRFH